MKDTIVESVLNQFKQRSETGIKKYGVTLDRTDLSTLEWIQHAQEEAMDLCLYLEKIKKQIKPFKNMVTYTEKDFAQFKKNAMHSYHSNENGCYNKKLTQWYDEKLEDRINIIGQNGNDGEHYT